MNHFRRTLVAAMALAPLALPAMSQAVDAYPTKPITIVYP
jgi:tripartite-type tricarboxylate transporter receptor subunit TctC